MPRMGLTRDVVTRAAADLADETGWENLTLAALAARLGVRQPSLYKHIESLAALRRAVSQLALTELTDLLLRAIAGRSGSEALLRAATAYRHFARSRPGRYSASVIAPAPDDHDHARASDQALRTLAAVLRGYDSARGHGDGDDGSFGDDNFGDAVHGDAVHGDGNDGDYGDASFGDAASSDNDIGDGNFGDAEPAVPSDIPMLHAIRALRAMLHGFVALEASGGFGLPLDLDESYRRMIAGFDAVLRQGRPAGDHAPGSTAPGSTATGSTATGTEKSAVTDR